MSPKCCVYIVNPIMAYGTILYMVHLYNYHMVLVYGLSGWYMYVNCMGVWIVWVYGCMSVLIVGVGVDFWLVWVYMCMGMCMVCVIECCVLLLCMCMCGVGGWEWASGQVVCIWKV